MKRKKGVSDGQRTDAFCTFDQFVLGDRLIYSEPKLRLVQQSAPSVQAHMFGVVCSIDRNVRPIPAPAWSKSRLDILAFLILAFPYIRFGVECQSIN